MPLAVDALSDLGTPLSFLSFSLYMCVYTYKFIIIIDMDVFIILPQ